ncbi:MAG: siroheme synthase CysG [Pseudomonadota bacterium]
MKRFPLFADLSSLAVVIIGGGVSAQRKARLAVAAGARPCIIWGEIDDALREEFADSARLIEEDPTRADLADARVVFVALEDAVAAKRWANEAKAAGALVNVVDEPSLCDFTTPSIIDRGRLTIAISTDGAGPVFGKAIRAKIEALAPARADALLGFAEDYRDAVAAAIPQADRRAFWEDFFNGPIAAAILAGDDAGAREAMLAAIHRPDDAASRGIVHLVGAGPGDPELLTLKALRLLQSADVIVYDRLVSEDILALARRDADRLYVGKAKADHAVPQDEIIATLGRLAGEGKTVVRLKGGDPFIFGRGGEELNALRAAGVEVFVTPGITAAAGCAAATGVALTHRDYAQAVTFVTGHAKGDEEPDLDWRGLAKENETAVVYMGVSKAPAIAAKLIESGRAADTPVAVIENGTRPDQRIVKTTLSALGSAMAAHEIKGPALLIIGEAARSASGAGLIEIAEQARRAA